jgi:hypothetical protein
MENISQTIQVGKKIYDVVECEPFKKCILCQHSCMPIPCITHAALALREFSVEMCDEKLGNNHYPKEKSQENEKD